jgi:xylan 1,4-beta-xylosidase
MPPSPSSLARLLPLLWLPLALAAPDSRTNVRNTNIEIGSFTYRNPISAGLDPMGVRDCQIFRDGGRWWMTVTAWPHWPRQEAWGIFNPGVVLYSSHTLTEWTFERLVVPAPPSGSGKWWQRRFWAPEIHQLDGRYYATFNASNPEAGYPGQHLGYAVSDALLGPYRVVTDLQPLGNGNDLTLFRDTDGRTWAFWNRGHEFGIGFAELDLAAGRFLTEPRSAIRPGRVDYALNPDGSPAMVPGYDGRPVRKVSRYHAWDSIGIEGAFVVRRGDTYYLFYSSWTRGYEIGYAMAPSVTGPWTKEPQPFYGEQSAATCARNGLPFTGNPDSPFNQVGHNQVFTGPDGRLWLSCHGILKERPDQPMLVIDPIEFDDTGRIVPSAPSFTPQQVAIPTR